MSAVPYAIHVEQGSTYVRSFLLEDDDGVIPLDEDVSIKMQVRPEVGSATLYAEFSTANGAIVLGDNTTSSFVLTIEAPVSTAWNWPRPQGVYDLEVTYSDGTVTRLLKGAFVVDREVTK